MTVTIDLISQNSKVWNANDVLMQIKSITTDKINLCCGVEGPCCNYAKIDDLIHKAISLYDLEPSQFTVSSGNHIKSSNFNEEFNQSTTSLYDQYSKKANTLSTDIHWDSSKIFGIFIGRSNWPRLDIASHLYSCHYETTLMQYHFDFNNEWHQNNFELEEFILRNNDNKSIDRICNFLKALPIRDKEFTYPIQHNNIDDLPEKYKKIFVDIVCETFYAGKTFHISEKILRPVLFKRPFIIQASKHFLQHLRTIGFKTFSQWWDEGYDEDPWDYKPTAIKSIIDTISAADNKTHLKWYTEMSEVLDHNYRVLQNLENTDWKEINKLLNDNCDNLDYT